MGSVQILNPAVSLVSVSQSRKKILRFGSNGCTRYFPSKRFKICCAVGEDNEQNKGEEPPESLFMQELRKRGMTPASLLEDAKRGNYGLDEEMKVGEEGGSFSKRNAVSTDYERNLSNQREQSMQLNSEGLEGLIPRAKLLLSLGGTFFLAFWPLILLTVAFFSATYLYFGSSFIHDGNNMPSTPPQYVDPYALLEDERISPTAPRVD
ncbi:hypothetical protein SLEP1_g29995 [Rubroshorea leprosula]|uniref:Tubulin alpha-6 chain n=1 Tax=Rubroshorea leprosula TaxID=152421 RepID=A0AAV5K4I2_9ROSI|nr:hypothetical protein SLEP1_g29995 [Rubroshorea leprosula]